MEGFIKQPIEKYLITGIWVDYQSMPQYYCVHAFLNPGVSGGNKLTLQEVVSIIETEGLSVFTWEWNYKSGRFSSGQRVLAKEGYNGKYLYIDGLEKETKNLKHLIRINWFRVQN